MSRRVELDSLGRCTPLLALACIPGEDAQGLGGRAVTRSGSAERSDTAPCSLLTEGGSQVTCIREARKE